MFATRIKHGITGGLVGGVIFGIMMAVMGSLPMIGGMIGHSNAIAGFLVHLTISAGIGAGFGVVLGPLASSRRRSVAAGLFYGAIWWILGPLTLMPLMMGMGLGVNWTAAAATAMLPSLMGHVIFGLVLGFVYDRAENCYVTSVFKRRRTGGARQDDTDQRPTPRVV